MGYVKLELPPILLIKRAVDEARTRDLHLGKVALYQLSYYRMLGVGGKSAGEETRTLTPKYQILSLARLPFRHARTCKT